MTKNYRDLHPGMGQAVADRTVLRDLKEDWGKVADRVAFGNLSLDPDTTVGEMLNFRDHIANARILMSGRHLQHGDGDQWLQTLELYSNCSTALTSFLSFYLLLNGSGVGRSYDDDLMLLDWKKAPKVICSLSSLHPDYTKDCTATLDLVDLMNDPTSLTHIVPDSREGWAETLMLWHDLALDNPKGYKTLHLDFSQVRGKGSPIAGMQQRPAAGPVPTMEAFNQAQAAIDTLSDRWEIEMHLDHHFADCVLVGGARRSARIAVKHWKDPGIIKFINIKTSGGLWSANNSVGVDTEFYKGVQDGDEWAIKVCDELIKVGYGTGEPGVINLDKLTQDPIEPDWVPNISSQKLQLSKTSHKYMETALIACKKKQHSMIVNPCVTDDTWIETESGPVQVKNLLNKPFKAKVNGKLYNSTGFFKTGENRQIYKVSTSKGFSLRATDNHQVLTFDGQREEWITIRDLDISKHLMVTDLGTSVSIQSIEKDGTEDVYDCKVDEVHRFSASGIIVHNCGEIKLSVWGGFCVIADVVPFFADDLDQAEDCFRIAARALIRVNTMESVYQDEVERTNRIGVGMTGVHEFAWKFFKLGFKDLIDENKSIEFWKTLARFRDAVIDESIKYCTELGLTIPHSMITIKPAGSTSKLFGLTEGWHLPKLAYYLRWVQFRSDDPLLEEYRDKGYSIKELVKYKGSTCVGFPTKTMISNLGLGDKLTFATEATVEEHYKWLQLGEKYWIGEDYGNQISYTLEYDPAKVSQEEFKKLFLEYQPTIKCCAVLPKVAPEILKKEYEYLPEEPITEQEFHRLMSLITDKMVEDVDKVHIDCAGGACPVDFNKEEV